MAQLWSTITQNGVARYTFLDYLAMTRTFIREAYKVPVVTDVTSEATYNWGVKSGFSPFDFDQSLRSESWEFESPDNFTGTSEHANA